MFIFCFGLSMYSWSECTDVTLRLVTFLMGTLAKGSQARLSLTAAGLVGVYIFTFFGTTY